MDADGTIKLTLQNPLSPQNIILTVIENEVELINIICQEVIEFGVAYTTRSQTCCQR